MKVMPKKMSDTLIGKESLLNASTHYYRVHTFIKITKLYNALDV